MTKEEFITKSKELAVDFWTMNLHKGTYETHLRELLDEYETKQCNIANVVGQSEQLKAEGRKEATEEIRQWLIEMDYEGLAESL